MRARIVGAMLRDNKKIDCDVECFVMNSQGCRSFSDVIGKKKGFVLLKTARKPERFFLFTGPRLTEVADLKTLRRLKELWENIDRATLNTLFRLESDRNLRRIGERHAKRLDAFLQRFEIGRGVTGWHVGPDQVPVIISTI